MTTYSQTSINAIRFLAIDAVQKANSGHPGAPMGMAPMAYVLWRDFRTHNPRNPQWFNRDRFVLSAGHASMLLYALLHLTGYELTIDDIKRFRQWESITPGHPESNLTPGVDATTGPLGQGVSNAVGMALAESILADAYNQPDCEIVNHRTYALVSDGDIEEGVANEAVSLAGTLKLHKLICLYDDNDISIDGSTDYHLREDVPARFRACGWNTFEIADGNDLAGIAAALQKAHSSDKPTLIAVKTVIGYGSPNKGGAAASHGAPLGADEVALTRKELGWNHPPFEVPPEVYDDLRAPALERGEQAEKSWNALFGEFKRKYGDLAATFENGLARRVPAAIGDKLKQIVKDNADKPLATRSASELALQVIAAELPYFIGGSADLAESNKTAIKGRTLYQPNNRGGRAIQFGIREHAMGAISNGMALHGGVIPFAATFLVFADYMRPSVRLSALSQLQVIWVYTHDSLGVGEDGPTHQPVSHLMGLRLIPDLSVFRPADIAETAAAWNYALSNQDRPTALIFARQATPSLTALGVQPQALANCQRGGYVAADGACAAEPQIILIATGSEVALALESRAILESNNVACRVVSLPCWELFDAQDERYRDSVLPPGVKARLSIEAGATLGWQKYVGDNGASIGVDRFGASAPGQVVLEKYGFNPANVVNQALKLAGVR